MSKTIHNQLIELTSEFATLRQSGKRNWFPKAVWQKAVSIAEQFSIAKVCKAIKVHPAYMNTQLNWQREAKSSSLNDKDRKEILLVRMENSDGDSVIY